jgi:L-2-hydroxyglutarate oxidase
MKHKSCEYLIIGGGIIGTSIAKSLAKQKPNSKIIILEKDKKFGQNNSILNSGVIHAGLYYQKTSNRAKYCIRGNKLLRDYHYDNKIPLKHCGKLIVPKNKDEADRITNLYNQGIGSGIELELIDNSKATSIEPSFKANGDFPIIYSPNTCVGNPKQLFHALEKEIDELPNVEKIVCSGYESKVHDGDNIAIRDINGNYYETAYFINASGLYSDKIAKDFNLALELTMLPIIGTYLIDNQFMASNMRTLIYPLPPNTKGNNFLGIHTTLTTDGELKLGPTALPCFWREQHKGLSGFKLSEFLEQIYLYWALLSSNNGTYYLKLLSNELRNQFPANVISEGKKLINYYDKLTEISSNRFKFKTGGIRTQMVDQNFDMINDFMFVKRKNQLHLLNMISPGWTSALAIAEDIENIMQIK